MLHVFKREMCSHTLSERKTVVHRQSLSRHFVTTMRQRAFHVANQIQGAARRGLAACAVDYTRRRRYPDGPRPTAVPADALRHRPPHQQSQGRKSHEEAYEDEGALRGPPRRCSSHWFPHRRPIARKPMPREPTDIRQPRCIWNARRRSSGYAISSACDAIALLGSSTCRLHVVPSSDWLHVTPSHDPRVPDTAANRLTTPPLHSASAR